MILVGLGSNQGDSCAVVRAAILQLRRFAAGGDLRASHLYQTAPVDCPPDADLFINAVAGFEPRPGVTPRGLLFALKGLEREFGRRDAPVRNAPRILDLDLLVFGAERRRSPGFTLPHPRAHLRRFVLAPAAELAPDLIWPGTGSSVLQLLAALPPGEAVLRLESGAGSEVPAGV
jgi:2-amino-4-hydroxy-6-hydroxymethyldihydropteridine diphosphokinase